MTWHPETSALTPPKWLARVEIIIVVICIVLFSEGVVQRLVTGEQDVDGNIILRIMWLPVYAAIALIVLARIKDMALLAIRMPFLCLMVALAAASFLWSIDPALSLRRGVSVTMTTVFGLYLAVRFDWRDLLKLMGFTWLGLALLSAAAGLVAPEFARMQEIHPGTWRGFWFEKNTLGGHMARAGLIFAFLTAVDAPRRPIWLMGLLLSGLLVGLSTSATSAMGYMLAVGVVGAGIVIQMGRVHAIAVLWLGAAATSALGAFIVLAPEVFFGLFGKDPTLTGRTDIWATLTGSISERPWLGYGYGAFWAPDSEPAFWVREVLDWDAPTAHNGWLDVLLSVGFIGLAAFMLNFAATLFRAVRIAFDHRFGLFACGLLAQYMLFSMSESILLEQNSLVWISYVTLSALLVRGAGRTGQITRKSEPSRTGLRSRLGRDGTITV